MTADPITVEPLEGGAVWRVTLGGSRGNILDAALTTALARVAAEAARAPALKAMCLTGAGTDFSFGASVQEHLPEQVAGMLARFHGLVRALLDSPVVLVAAVRGQCLGGGLELATLCQRVIATRDARLGQPEIALGVFAPVASVLLAERIGRPRAEDLCLSGRVVDADEAQRMGLVDQVVDGDPVEAAVEWARQHMLPHSAASLRHATRALRLGMRQRLEAELPAVERLYLDQLMATHDAVEGLRAFLEKRPPRWRDA